MGGLRPLILFWRKYGNYRNFSACLALVNDIERLGDHLLNTSESSYAMSK